MLYSPMRIIQILDDMGADAALASLRAGARAGSRTLRVRISDLIGMALLAAVVSAVPAAVSAADVASPWDVGHRSKARLIFGGDAKGAPVAGLELVMQPGWKTYWRNPGDAGGVPPYFDWSNSRNLKRADVYFPVPHRYKDKTGTTIGYKERLVLPVRLVPEDPTKPIGVAVVAEFGVCLDICIPARAKLAMEVSPGSLTGMPAELKAALAAVPRTTTGPGGRLPYPRLVTLERGSAPKIVIEIDYPAGIVGADLFVEAAGDLYLPVAVRAGTPRPGTVRFHIDASDGVDLAALKGRELRLTMVSDAGSAEGRVTVR